MRESFAFLGTENYTEDGAESAEWGVTEFLETPRAGSGNLLRWNLHWTTSQRG